jgi:GT2 family glycosyltransferase
MEKVNIGLSIIILSYKSKKHLEVLLPSVFGSEGLCYVGPATHSAITQGGPEQSRGANGGQQTELGGQPMAGPTTQADKLQCTTEVIIVDNDSRDGTVEWLENRSALVELMRGRALSEQINYRIIKNQNTGFAAGNNLGIRQSQGKYILLLNPDTKVESDTFKTMLDFMESRPDVGISGCKIIKPDGKLDLACRRRFPNPWNSFARLFLKNNQNYNYSDVDENQEMEVDSVVGAFLLIRKSVIDKIGLLDEQFFMYGEDLDWCWRCKEAGFKVWYYPKTFVTHFKGASSRKEPFKMLKAFHDAMWIFYQKHYAKQYPFFFNWFVWLGIYGRMTALITLNLFKSDRVVS